MINLIRKRDDRPKPLGEEQTLKGLITVCSCCKKIHIDNKTWQQLEIRLIQNSNVALSHGLCPSCYEEQRVEFMEFISRQTFDQPIAGVG